MGDTDKDVWHRVLSDYKSQLAHVEGMRDFAESMNVPFEDPRRSNNGGDRDINGLWKSAKPASQKEVPKNPLTIPYLLYAYDVPRSSFKRRVAADRKGQSLDTYDGRCKTRPFISVIESRTAALGLYTARFFYVHERIIYGDNDQIGVKHSERVKQLGLDFDRMVKEGVDISRWERQAREHDARHEYIKQELIDALEAQVCRSYRQLSRVSHGRKPIFSPRLSSLFIVFPLPCMQLINGWCSARTIERWLHSHPSYEVYRKNIKPGLTEVDSSERCLVPPQALCLYCSTLI